MYIKRPAVALTVAYLGALGTANLLWTHGLSLWFLAPYTVAVLLILIFAFRAGKHRLLLAAIVAAVLFAGWQFHRKGQTHALWETMHGREIFVCGVIEDVTYTSDNISYMTANIFEADGKKTSARISLSATGGMHLSKFEAFSGKIKITDEECDSYDRARGIVREAELLREDFTSQGTQFSVCGWFEGLRTKLCAPLSRYVDYETYSFLAGMVFGDRDAISKEIARDFRRTGTSHMLAVSGTHLSIVVACLYYLCKKCRMRRVPMMVLLAGAIVMIVGITGFSLSVLRAALMWGIGALAYVFGGRRDGYSALAMAVFLLCVWDVHVIYDVGLQMSALCTLGILVLGIPTEKWLLSHFPSKKMFRVLVQSFIMPAALTVGATIFTLPTALFSYGEISWIAPLAHLLITLPTTFLLIATPVFLVLMLLPIGFPAQFLAYAISLVTKLTLWAMRLLSDLPHPLIGLGYSFTPIVLLLFCVLTAILSFRKRSALVIYVSFFVSAALFVLCTQVYYTIHCDRVTAVYQMHGQNESVGLIQGENAVLIDISNGASSAMQEMWQTVSDRQITELEAVILTHYDRKHDGMLADLCAQTVVRNLYLPKPKTDKDMEIYSMIRDAQYTHYTACHMYDPIYEELHFGSAEILLSETEYLSRSAVPITIISVDVGTERLSYVSAAAWETTEGETRIRLEQILCNTDYLICGNHGPKVKRAYGMRIDSAPYPFVSIPLREYVELFSHAANARVTAQDVEYVEIQMHASTP